MDSKYLFESMQLTEEISRDVLNQAIEFVEQNPHSEIDLPNKTLRMVFDSKSTAEDLMEPGMFGDWFVKHGFNVDFEKRDVEYMTKDRWVNWYKGSTPGHKAYLRNRLVMTITWE